MDNWWMMISGGRIEQSEGRTTYRFLSTTAKKRSVIYNMVVLRRLLEGDNDKRHRRLSSSPPSLVSSPRCCPGGAACRCWCYDGTTNFFLLMLNFGNKIVGYLYLVPLQKSFDFCVVRPAWKSGRRRMWWWWWWWCSLLLLDWWRRCVPSKQESNRS